VKIKTVAVIGAGCQGRTIVIESALAGYATVLEDTSQSALEKALSEIEGALAELVTRGCLTLERKAAALARITTTSEIEDACRRADLLIEALPEDLETQLEIFTILDRFARPGAIFVTASASAAVADLAEITFCPEFCAAMRFTDEDGVPSVSVVSTSATGKSTLEACAEFGERLGRRVTILRETGDSIASSIRGALR
jgi:3-hydroxybutyryl-CoA dehydrogenase